MRRRGPTLRCAQCATPLDGERVGRCPECGVRYELMERVDAALIGRPLRVVRAIIVGAGLLWCIHLAMRQRSLGFGPSAASYLEQVWVICVFGMVPIGVALLPVWLLDVRARTRVYTLTLLALIVLPIFLSEAWCGAQELTFYMRHRERPTWRGAVYERRWWPNTDRRLQHDPWEERWTSLGS